MPLSVHAGVVDDVRTWLGKATQSVRSLLDDTPAEDIVPVHRTHVIAWADAIMLAEIHVAEMVVAVDQVPPPAVVPMSSKGVEAAQGELAESDETASTPQSLPERAVDEVGVSESAELFPATHIHPEVRDLIAAAPVVPARRTPSRAKSRTSRSRTEVSPAKAEQAAELPPEEGLEAEPSANTQRKRRTSAANVASDSSLARDAGAASSPDEAPIAQSDTPAAPTQRASANAQVEAGDAVAEHVAPARASEPTAVGDGEVAASGSTTPLDANESSVAHDSVVQTAEMQSVRVDSDGAQRSGEAADSNEETVSTATVHAVRLAPVPVHPGIAASQEPVQVETRRFPRETALADESLVDRELVEPSPLRGESVVVAEVDSSVVAQKVRKSTASLEVPWVCTQHVLFEPADEEPYLVQLCRDEDSSLLLMSDLLEQASACRLGSFYDQLRDGVFDPGAKRDDALLIGTQMVTLPDVAKVLPALMERYGESVETFSREGMLRVEQCADVMRMQRLAHLRGERLHHESVHALAPRVGEVEYIVSIHSGRAGAAVSIHDGISGQALHRADLPGWDSEFVPESIEYQNGALIIVVQQLTTRQMRCVVTRDGLVCKWNARVDERSVEKSTPELEAEAGNEKESAAEVIPKCAGDDASQLALIEFDAGMIQRCVYRAGSRTLWYEEGSVAQEPETRSELAEPLSTRVPNSLR